MKFGVGRDEFLHSLAGFQNRMERTYCKLLHGPHVLPRGSGRVIVWIVEFSSVEVSVWLAT